MRKQIVLPIINDICSELDIGFLQEPTRGIYAVLCFPNGRKFYVKDINFNMNLATTASLCTNKAACSYFLNKMGYCTPEFTIVYSKEPNALDAGLEFCNKMGYPLILKPNNLSQGRYIFKINNNAEYYEFGNCLLKVCDTFQIQKYYSGNDYRIVVLNGRPISVYQRIPLFIIGDGTSTISQLLDLKQNHFSNTGRDTIINQEDIRIQHKLQEYHLNLQSVIPKKQTVYLHDISNLSVGGETRELTAFVHPSFVELARKITNDLNLVLCGIDIITTDIAKQLDNYIILEINSAPGLDNYAFEGERQSDYVKDLYRQIIVYISQEYDK